LGFVSVARDAVLRTGQVAAGREAELARLGRPRDDVQRDVLAGLLPGAVRARAFGVPGAEVRSGTGSDRPHPALAPITAAAATARALERSSPEHGAAADSIVEPARGGHPDRTVDVEVTACASTASSFTTRVPPSSRCRWASSRSARLSIVRDSR